MYSIINKEKKMVLKLFVVFFLNVLVHVFFYAYFDKFYNCVHIHTLGLYMCVKSITVLFLTNSKSIRRGVGYPSPPQSGLNPWYSYCLVCRLTELMFG